MYLLYYFACQKKLENGKIIIIIISSNNCSSDVRLQDGTAAVSSGLTNVFFSVFLSLQAFILQSTAERTEKDGGRESDAPQETDTLR